MSRWPEQLERAKRFRTRLDPQLERADYDDFLWSFFQHCWHVKDWMKNDGSIADSGHERFEESLKERKALMICADLANGTKHLELDRERHPHRPGAEHHGWVHKLELGPATSYTWHPRVVLENGTELNALEVADDALKEWDEVIAEWGLSRQ